jgi:isoamylase
MGASLTGDGVNFAVFSAHAETDRAVPVHLGRAQGDGRLPIGDRDGDIWHIHVGGLTVGTVYGFRAHGPYAPEQGHRFNPNKLLLDPYARALEGRLKWSDALMGYKIGSPRGDLSFDTRDSAFAVPKAVVTDASFTWGNDQAPRIPRAETLIYEAHVKSMTALHPGVEKGCAAPTLAFPRPGDRASAQAGRHRDRASAGAGLIDDRFLVSKGLRNHWGYNTLAFFAPEPRYMARARSGSCRPWSAAFMRPGSR